MIPLIHNFEDKTVLVIGGGQVGARKARWFSDETDVIVLSPEFTDEEFGTAQLIRTAPDAIEVQEWIARISPWLVVAATNDSTLNERIETVAIDAGSLINRVDRHANHPERSVIVPATIRDDPVVVAISTSGFSPTLSQYLREQIRDSLYKSGEMARITEELRMDLINQEIDASRRRTALRAVVSSQAVWDALRSNETTAMDTARQIAQKSLNNTE